MSGGRTSAESAGSRAHLAGPGWGGWTGVWKTQRFLEGRHGEWRLIEGETTTAQWAVLSEAIEDLWEGRKVRDHSPWAVGWIGYEACAQLAGDLPGRYGVDDVPAALLLLEPERAGAENVLSTGSPSGEALLRSSLDKEQFHRGVRTIKELIAEGTVYQVNLCRRFTVDSWEGGLQRLFEAASSGCPVPDYLSAFTWQGRSPGELVCASMELLVSRRKKNIETRPIKGTVPRGVTVEDDDRLIRQLETDPKELAELAMIVDLERNDMGRVARTGSVVVDDTGQVRSWERIHHRVARIKAEVPGDTPWQDIVGVMAPGGSVTGCPKMSAMSVISNLEPVGRGPFTGALGVITGDGDLELALPIRTAWTTNERLEMAAGCGIVWESDPVAEEAESRLKIEKWLDLLKM